jgi:hypothetical protein
MRSETVKASAGFAGKPLRQQSVLEFVLTYGWAILLIAIVLGAMYAVGLFRPSIPTHAFQIPGICANPL